MGKVIDISKYMSKEALQRMEKGPSVSSPKVYSVRFEVDTSEETGAYSLEYYVSNKALRETLKGKQILFEHLTAVVLNMCDDDPAMITELCETLEEYVFDANLEED